MNTLRYEGYNDKEGYRVGGTVWIIISVICIVWSIYTLRYEASHFTIVQYIKELLVILVYAATINLLVKSKPIISIEIDLSSHLITIQYNHLIFFKQLIHIPLQSDNYIHYEKKQRLNKSLKTVLVFNLPLKEQIIIKEGESNIDKYTLNKIVADLDSITKDNKDE